MILSYGLWTRRFHSDRNIIGRSVQVNGHDCIVIGVMPPDFDFPLRIASTARTPSQHMDFWAPLGIDPARISRASAGYGAVARLCPGVSRAEAEQDLNAIGFALAREYPRTNIATLHIAPVRDRWLGFAQTGLSLLLAAAAMFMMIGCANVANLPPGACAGPAQRSGHAARPGFQAKRVLASIIIPVRDQYNTPGKPWKVVPWDSRFC